MKDLAKTIGVIPVLDFRCTCVLLDRKPITWRAAYHSANDPIQPYIGLILTDVGVLVRSMVFIGCGEGLVQRSIAILRSIVDLAGAILLAAGRLLTAGQTLTDVPAQLGDALVWGLVALHL